MKTVIIVQARMTSTRLPGKVLKEVLGKPLLEYLVERLRRVTLADEIVIATTTNDTDLPIVACCKRLGVMYTRGPELDVLARYHAAAVLHHADVVVRVTSDCPLIDPENIDSFIRHFQQHRGTCDYLSSALERSYPLGMDAEVFSFKALTEAFAEANIDEDREHVTSFIYRRPQRYSLVNYRSDVDLSAHRWTVDTSDDFVLIEKIITELYPVKPCFLLADLRKLLLKYPYWAEINSHVIQKKLIQQH